MVDRHDIDALLIGSLYGELSSADEARLQAHLESHPADRTALHDLTRARNAVRESRILQHQLEPPQSITALLLQEAARRAPRKSHGEAGWLQRFLRSLVAHPAMAAATMLVLVLGVAGTLYLRQGEDHLSAGTAREELPPASQIAQADKQEIAPASDAPAVAPTPEPVTADGRTGYPVRLEEGEASTNRAAAKQDVRDEERAKGAKEQAQATAKAEPKPPAKEAPATTDGLYDLRKDDPYARPPAQPPKLAKSTTATPAKKKPAAPRSAGPNRVLEVGTPQHAPLEIAGDTDAKAADKTVDRTVTRPDTGGGGGTASGAAAGAPQAPAADPKPAFGRAPEPNRGRADSSASQPSVTPSAPPPSPPPPPAAPSRNEAGKDKVGAAKPPAATPAPAPSDENKREAQSPELAWARDLHARVITQVRAGKCPDAARLALTLSQRAPAYYEANVLHDRQLKDCVVYINAERDREAERAQRARAAKRGEEPKKAAPPAADKADAKASESNR